MGIKYDFKIDSETDINKPLICCIFKNVDFETNENYLSESLFDLAKQSGFDGNLSEVFILNVVENSVIKKFIFLGLGDPIKFDTARMRKASGTLGRVLKSNKILDCQLTLGKHEIFENNQAEFIANIVEGITLGLYKFDKWNSDKATQKEVKFQMAFIQSASDTLDEAISRGLSVSQGIILARDMVNSPANQMTPTDMASMAEEMSANLPLKVTVLEEYDMERLGMQSLLGVSKGSIQPAKLIVIEYQGDASHSDNNLALIGKGITFDTGGISLKPPGGMESMKGDMAGGASVFGAMRIIAELKPNINIMGIIAATENMPGGNAQKPGDVVTAMNGKTIEVINTDAEGRLVLADALCYADSKGIVNAVDIATLTGAMVVSLGKICTGYMTNSSDFANRLVKASQTTGEKFWELPIFDEYDDLIKSDVADMKNTGGRQAGSITAAKLLQRFVGDMNWIHLDIAGTSTSAKNDGEDVKGATGHPVRTLVQLALDMSRLS